MDKVFNTRFFLPILLLPPKQSTKHDEGLASSRTTDKKGCCWQTRMWCWAEPITYVIHLCLYDGYFPGSVCSDIQQCCAGYVPPLMWRGVALLNICSVTHCLTLQVAKAQEVHPDCMEALTSRVKVVVYSKQVSASDQHSVASPATIPPRTYETNNNN